jgi:hypothetical protein
LQYGTVQYWQYGMVQYDSVQYWQYGMVRYGIAIWYGAIWYGAIWQCNIVLQHGVDAQQRDKKTHTHKGVDAQQLWRYGTYSMYWQACCRGS